MGWGSVPIVCRRRTEALPSFTAAGIGSPPFHSRSGVLGRTPRPRAQRRAARSESSRVHRRHRINAVGLARRRGTLGLLALWTAAGTLALSQWQSRFRDARLMQKRRAAHRPGSRSGRDGGPPLDPAGFSTNHRSGGGTPSSAPEDTGSQMISPYNSDWYDRNGGCDGISTRDTCDAEPRSRANDFFPSSMTALAREFLSWRSPNTLSDDELRNRERCARRCRRAAYLVPQQIEARASKRHKVEAYRRK